MDLESISRVRAKHIFKHISYEFEYGQLVVKKEIDMQLCWLAIFSFIFALLLLCCALIFNKVVLTFPTIYFLFSIIFYFISNIKRRYTSCAGDIKRLISKAVEVQSDALFLITHATILSNALGQINRNNNKKRRLLSCSVICFLIGMFMSFAIIILIDEKVLL
ncbi:hypothetical protein [Fangia hongkongensis]|uniref:hypothetical protein n=1 Tax=Fangia hongkongensis TaxID=270495 RepID=UPI000376927A|nr:hypothetical protein [Fangia hongkongensis]